MGRVGPGAVGNPGRDRVGHGGGGAAPGGAPLFILRHFWGTGDSLRLGVTAFAFLVPGPELRTSRLPGRRCAVELHPLPQVTDLFRLSASEALEASCTSGAAVKGIFLSASRASGRPEPRSAGGRGGRGCGRGPGRERGASRSSAHLGERLARIPAAAGVGPRRGRQGALGPNFRVCPRSLLR